LHRIGLTPSLARRIDCMGDAVLLEYRGLFVVEDAWALVADVHGVNMRPIMADGQAVTRACRA
jgi:hypothetical protein